MWKEIGYSKVDTYIADQIIIDIYLRVGKTDLALLLCRDSWLENIIAENFSYRFGE